MILLKPLKIMQDYFPSLPNNQNWQLKINVVFPYSGLKRFPSRCWGFPNSMECVRASIKHSTPLCPTGYQ